jgi:predicted nuclease of predicted toxin-antitoxin system
VRIKLDENLPLRLSCILSQQGHEIDTVLQEGLAGQDDAHVWQAAQTASRFFITQDLDFSDVRRFLPGTHHGLLLVRLRDPGRNALVKRVRNLFQTEDVEAWKQCFVVATEHKIRVRSPKKKSDLKHN